MVERDLKNLNSKSSKLSYLKGNISIRVTVLGWEDLSMHRSKNGKTFTPEDLTLHPKIIVPKQRSCSIPTET